MTRDAVLAQINKGIDSFYFYMLRATRAEGILMSSDRRGEILMHDGSYLIVASREDLKQYIADVLAHADAAEKEGSHAGTA